MADTDSSMLRKKSEKQIDIEMKKLKAFLNAIIPNDVDRYDWKSKYDSSLSYMENKNAIIEDLKALYPNEFREANLKGQAEAVKAIEERLNTERDKRIEAEIIAYNENREYADSIELDAFYKSVHRSVQKVVQGFSNLAFIKGRGGVGKSWNIKKALLQNGAKFTEVAGDITEAYLYRLLFEHNGEVIWIRDVARLLTGLKSISLLKSATETEGERLLTKQSYSKQQDDLPSRFIFRGKIIFDYNEIVGLTLKEDFEALQTRGDYVELSMSMDDVEQIMRLITKEPWEKEVTEFLIGNYSFSGQNLLNLRTQWKAFRTYEYAAKNSLDWKIELQQELASSISRVRGMLYSLMGNKAMRTAELKKLLMKYGIVQTMRTADRKIDDWVLTEELHRCSYEERNYFIALNPIKLSEKEQKDIPQQQINQ